MKKSWSYTLKKNGKKSKVNNIRINVTKNASIIRRPMYVGRLFCFIMVVPVRMLLVWLNLPPRPLYVRVELSKFASCASRINKKTSLSRSDLCFIMVVPVRIELTLPVPQTGVLPLNYGTCRARRFYRETNFCQSYVGRHALSLHIFWFLLRNVDLHSLHLFSTQQRQPLDFCINYI